MKYACSECTGRSARHGAARGDQRLPGHLAAEHPLESLVGAPAAEDVDLDLLEVEQFQQVVQSLAHDLVTVPFRSEPRNLDGFLDGFAPGERAAAQDSSTRSLALVTPM